MKEQRTLNELSFTHRFIPGDTQRSPTLLLLHGSGGNENDLIEMGEFLCPGAALLSPRGKVLENGRPRFFRRFAEGVFDLKDLRLRTGELADFVKQGMNTYGLDPSAIIAVGYSNGANMAASLLLLKPGVLAAAILFHAMVPLVPDHLPDLDAVPVFLTAGRRDVMIPPAETERLVRLLESAGAAVHLSWQPEGHSLSQSELEAARDWLSGLRMHGKFKN